MEPMEVADVVNDEAEREEWWGSMDVPFAESIKPHLVEKLRSFVCGYPWQEGVVSDPDHGHTSCLFWSLAADRIEELEKELGR